MPPVVHRRTQLHPDLAHDLRPQMECLAGVPPCLKWESWPALRSFPLLCLAYAFHMLLVLLVVSLLHSRPLERCYCYNTISSSSSSSQGIWSSPIKGMRGFIWRAASTAWR